MHSCPSSILLQSRVCYCTSPRATAVHGMRDTRGDRATGRRVQSICTASAGCAVSDARSRWLGSARARSRRRCSSHTWAARRWTTSNRKARGRRTRRPDVTGCSAVPRCAWFALTTWRDGWTSARRRRAASAGGSGARRRRGCSSGRSGSATRTCRSRLGRRRRGSRKLKGAVGGDCRDVVLPRTATTIIPL